MIKVNSFVQKRSIESNNSYNRRSYHAIIRQYICVVVVAGLTIGVALSPCLNPLSGSNLTLEDNNNMILSVTKDNVARYEL